VCDDRSRPYGWSWQRDAPSFSLPGMSPLQAVVLMTARAHLGNLLPASHMRELQPLFAQARRTLTATPLFEAAGPWPDKVALAPTTQALLPPHMDDDVLVAVHEAVYAGHQLQVDYVRRGETAPMHYTIHPLGLIQRGPVGYLAARIGKHRDVRLLAVHRIRRATALDAPVVVPRGFRIDALLPLVGAGFGRGKLIHLVVRMADHAALHLAGTPLSSDQTISTADADGFVTVKATVEDTAQLRWWLLGFGDYVDVLRPVSLRRELRAVHRRAATI
jgi:predicted DNA-binding transcriptional regulator YafY